MSITNLILCIHVWGIYNGQSKNNHNTVTIYAIGGAIVLMVGYIIISAVAGGLI